MREKENLKKSLKHVYPQANLNVYIPCTNYEVNKNTEQQP